MFYFFLFLFLLLSVLLTLVVLVQESKSLGLGASFGGDAGDSVFGTSTAQVLKTFTAWLGITFAVASILLSFWSEILTAPALSIPPSIEEVSGASGEAH